MTIILATHLFAESACLFIFRKGAVQISTAFQLKIVKATTEPGESGKSTLIIIRRPYAFLEAELRRAFEEQGDVQVVVDRRIRERRTSPQVVAVDSRHADRRTVKEEIVEVVISV